MPAAIPAIAAAAATTAAGGIGAIVFQGTMFAMTASTFGAIVGGAAALPAGVMRCR